MTTFLRKILKYLYWNHSVISKIPVNTLKQTEKKLYQLPIASYLAVLVGNHLCYRNNLNLTYAFYKHLANSVSVVSFTTFYLKYLEKCSLLSKKKKSHICYFVNWFGWLIWLREQWDWHRNESLLIITLISFLRDKTVKLIFHMCCKNFVNGNLKFSFKVPWQLVFPVFIIDTAFCHLRSFITFTLHHP